jgi:hypothetical protein
MLDKRMAGIRAPNCLTDFNCEVERMRGGHLSCGLLTETSPSPLFRAVFFRSRIEGGDWPHM